MQGKGLSDRWPDPKVSRDCVGLNPVTRKNYQTILSTVFLTFEVPPWYRNMGKRLVKSPKGFIGDTLALCHLLDRNPGQLQSRTPEVFGHVVENFVATELRKLISFGDVRVQLYHFRTSSGGEVDFVLERPDGTLAAIEVKSADHVTAAIFDGVCTLADAAGDQFGSGVVLHTGRAVVLFGEFLFALPLSVLWL